MMVPGGLGPPRELLTAAASLLTWPGELCALRGGVFVSTVMPRQRMASG